MLKVKALDTILYGRVTWCPRSCLYDALRRAHHIPLTCCIGKRKHKRTDHSISYIDTPVKTGSESIEVTSCERRILFAGFVARLKDTRMSKNSWRKRFPRGRQKNEWMECLLVELRVFSIKTNQWMTSAQDSDKWDTTIK